MSLYREQLLRPRRGVCRGRPRAGASNTPGRRSSWRSSSDPSRPRHMMLASMKCPFLETGPSPGGALGKRQCGVVAVADAADAGAGAVAVVDGVVAVRSCPSTSQTAHRRVAGEGRARVRIVRLRVMGIQSTSRTDQSALGPQGASSAGRGPGACRGCGSHWTWPSPCCLRVR
jgi:hypothetical protein